MAVPGWRVERWLGTARTARMRRRRRFNIADRPRDLTACAGTLPASRTSDRLRAASFKAVCCGAVAGAVIPPPPKQDSGWRSATPEMTLLGRRGFWTPSAAIRSTQSMAAGQPTHAAVFW
jgi:hypothetical protein